MADYPLNGKTVLITGAARRIGRALATACAQAGADVIIHHSRSSDEALELQKEINSLGRQAWIFMADFEQPEEAAGLISKANEIQPVDAVVNNAAIFEPLSVRVTTLADWERHLSINLTAPFLICRDFANQLRADVYGRIVNILDWRALRPGPDHFPYTISKAALAALTQSLAADLAPRISVNGLALGAILPPSNHPDNPGFLKQVPAGHLGALSDVQSALLFLLTGPAYITGEIIHVDGGRHLI
jgi:NAD(P)-dependent dehydrogenase (short-subunit alcohol dehydrogenase family)